MTTFNLKSIQPDTQRTSIVSNSVYLATYSLTPAQLTSYLSSNVTSLAQALPVLNVLLQGLAYFINQQTQTPTS